MSTGFSMSFQPDIRFVITPGTDPRTASAVIQVRFPGGEFFDAGSIEWDDLDRPAQRQVVDAFDEAAVAALPGEMREAIQGATAEVLQGPLDDDEGEDADSDAPVTEDELDQLRALGRSGVRELAQHMGHDPDKMEAFVFGGR